MRREKIILTTTTTTTTATTTAAATTTTTNNNIQFFIYLRAEHNSQWPITESERIQTTAIRQHRTKQTKKQI
jgi:hypothetical protein